MENTKPREKLLTTTAAINTARSTTITKRNVITSPNLFGLPYKQMQIHSLGIYLSQIHSLQIVFNFIIIKTKQK